MLEEILALEETGNVPFRAYPSNSKYHVQKRDMVKLNDFLAPCGMLLLSPNPPHPHPQPTKKRAQEKTPPSSISSFFPYLLLAYLSPQLATMSH